MENEIPSGDLPQTKPTVREPEEQKPSAAPGAPEDPRFHLLYKVLSAAFAGMILDNLGLCVLLIWQTKLVRAQLTQSRQLIRRSQRLEEPLVKDILSKLDGYALANRDFVPILQKYPGLFPRFQPTTSAPPATLSTSESILPPTPALPTLK